MIRRIYNILIHCILVMVALFVSNVVVAAGVPANTAISNTATVDYVIGGIAGSTTDTETFTVLELLDVSLIWQDAANVTTVSPSNNIVLTYELTNTGNGIDQYVLTVDGELVGDNFDIAPANLEIWIDDGDGSWNSALDTLYNGGVGPSLNGGLAGSDAINIFVVADVPDPLNAGDLSNIELTAVSNTALSSPPPPGNVGTVGAELVGLGDGGVNAIVGLSGATASAVGTIEIIASGVSITKSVTVIDTLGGNQPLTGATLRYSLNVQVTGSSNVDNLIIVDPIPTSTTTYTLGSITLGGVAQTDDQDDPVDYSDFNDSNADAVTVDLSEDGTVSIVPPANYIIEFEVTID